MLLTIRKGYLYCPECAARLGFTGRQIEAPQRECASGECDPVRAKQNASLRAATRAVLTSLHES